MCLTAGFTPLPADMAPQFAGVVYSVGSLGSIGAVVSTSFVSFVCGKNKVCVHSQYPFSLWRKVSLGILKSLLCKL